MPNVKGKKFPYTKSGMKAAQEYAKKPKKKKTLLKKVSK